VVYGVIVTLIGIFDDPAELEKAQGVRINLWMGISMLVLGGLFLLWLWWRPIEVAPARDSGDEKGPEAHGEN